MKALSSFLRYHAVIGIIRQHHIVGTLCEFPIDRQLCHGYAYGFFTILAQKSQALQNCPEYFLYLLRFLFDLSLQSDYSDGRERYGVLGRAQALEAARSATKQCGVVRTVASMTPRRS